MNNGARITAASVAPSLLNHRSEFTECLLELGVANAGARFEINVLGDIRYFQLEVVRSLSERTSALRGSFDLSDERIVCDCLLRVNSSGAEGLIGKRESRWQGQRIKSPHQASG